MQAKPKKDPEIAAFKIVHAALKPLDTDARQRVLASVLALLDMTVPAAGGHTDTTQHRSQEPQTRSSPSRPMSLVELIKEKSPGTSVQRIAVFAYHREKNEGISRFGRNDLKPYFSRAKEQPPANFDRDFVEAVRRGWIHEDSEDSYITTRGIEAVESGFAGERKYTKTAKQSRKKAASRTSGRKKRAAR